MDCRSSARAEAWAGSRIDDWSVASVLPTNDVEAFVNICAQLWEDVDWQPSFER